MCGLVGILNSYCVPVSISDLKNMTNAIKHRGPDGEGHWADGAVGLGHRRLSIIDPRPIGDQPMFSNSGRFVISYNGEVYNFLEIRRELESLGYKFKTNTDTEVVLEAWACWGAKALLKFNGMFAFAIWDRKEETLTLARDRYGIKPLYLSVCQDRTLFASEQKAIFAHKEFRKELDLDGLYEYFTFQNFLSDRTLFKNIVTFPAGHYVTVSLNNYQANDLKYTKYWDYNFTNPKGKVDKREYLEELDRLFHQSVTRQLVSDVELGCYLSGGMDSGSITAIAAKAHKDLKTFTCGFDLSSASGLELAFDERARAEQMSAVFKTEHYEMVLKSGDMQRVLPQLAFHLEEPRVGQSYPNFYAAKLASKFVKVVMSGSGGDELFGGYPWRYYRAVVNADFKEYSNKYYDFWQRLTTHQERQAMFSTTYKNIATSDTKEIFNAVFDKNSATLDSPEDYINYSLYFEAKTFLHGLFVVEDKLSMAHGLETRVPFMDNDLVDFSMSCPVSLKLNNLSSIIQLDENEPGIKANVYFQRTSDGKQILRDMMKKYIPEDITRAPKQGFSGPDESWFKGESINFVRERLLDSNSKIYEIIDFGATSKLVEEHLSGQKNRRLLIWSLLNVNEWINQNL